MIASTLRSRVFFLFTATLTVNVSSFGAPIPIPVTNGSFEKPDVLNLTPDGYPSDQNAAGGAQSAWQYTEQNATSSNKLHYYGPNNVNDAIPYWSVSGSNNAGMAYGVSNPISSIYSGTDGGIGGGYTLPANTDFTFNALAALNSSHGYGFADGYQNAFANLNSGGSVTLVYNPSDPNTGDHAGTGQSLGNFIPGDSYVLTAGVGTAINQGGYAYSITLLESFNGGANWIPVGTASSGNSPATASGDWIQATYAFTAGGLDTGLIGIELEASDPNSATAQANFDNVQLNNLGSGNAPPEPEPASLGLLSLGVFALRRRSRI
jgi:MYXO-CTERM domain-containing protein